MLKKILLLVFSFVLLLSFVVFADSSLSDEYFEIYNPNNGNTAIVSRDGKKLLSGVNNQSITYLVRDLFTGKPSFMYKKYIGEKIIEREESAGDGSWTMKDTSNRTLFYDLDGNFLFETENFASLNSVDDKVIYSYDNNCYIYDTKEKELKKYDFDTYTSFLDDKIVFSNYRYSDRNKVIDIYDKEFNLIKSIVGYEVDNEKAYGNQNYLLLSRLGNDGDSIYNFLDSDCNLLFDVDVENRTGVDEDSTEILFLYDNKEFSYDMAKKEYISSVSEITKEQKQVLKAEIDPYRLEGYMEENDANMNKVKASLPNQDAYVTSYDYNNKKIYVAEVERNYVVATNSKNEIYEEAVSYSNIYDSNANLLAERLIDIEMEPLDNGYIVSNNKVYDFDMRFVRDLPDTYDIERINIDDRTYFLDRVDQDYNNKNSQNLYDSNFNTVFEDCENIILTYERDWIFVTDHNSTKMYDKELNIIKDLHRKIEALSWQYTDNYIAFMDLNTKRYGILEKDGKVLIDNLKKIDSLRKDYFVYMNGFRYGIMDYDKNVIVSLSIFDDIKDDSNIKDYIVSEVGY